MQRVKTYISHISDDYEGQYTHLLDYEKDTFSVDEIYHIIEQMRLVHFELKYNIVIDNELCLFFDEF